MVTKNAETPTTIKQKRGRPSGYHRKLSFENVDPAKRERMAEYLRVRTLIHSWAKKVQTCDIPELIEIARDTLEIHAKMREAEPVVLLIFKEDFKHIEEVAAARLKNEKNLP